MKNMEIQFSQTKQVLFRVALYAFAILIIGEFLVLDIISFGGTNDFGQGSYTRYLEIAICSINSILLIWYMLKSNFKFRNIAFFIFGLVVSVGIIQSGKAASLWLIFILMFLPATLFLLKKNKKILFSEIGIYLKSFSFGIFFIGFMIAFVFSGMMGRDFFWTAVLEGTDYTLAQNAIKEGLKLLGSLLILLSTTELWILSENK